MRLSALALQASLYSDPYTTQPKPQDVSIPHRHLNDSVCPASVDHFTGSVDIGYGKSLFYWLFSSASDPATDPLLIWLTGGPGAASTYAAVTEIGPCLINASDNSTYHNPYHWAKNANLLILDQPAGVGFSVASSEPSRQIKTLEAATEDFVDFMHGFFHRYPHLSQRTLHIAGESYGGRWAPAFMHELQSLKEAQSARALPSQLGSIILVNAVVGALGGELTTANYEFGCTPDGVATRLGLGFTTSLCSKIQEAAGECESYASLCESTDSTAVCKGAWDYCNDNIGRLIPLGNQSIYNVAHTCENPEEFCLTGLNAAVNFFNRPDIQEAMGIENRQWSAFDTKLSKYFDESGATTRPVISALRDLLNSGTIRVLVMNGDLDSLVLSPGQIRVFDRISWRGHIDYRQQAWQPWSVGDSTRGTSGGHMKNSSNLKFVTFQNAGHMVPGDDPAGASAILTQWLSEH